MKWIGQHIYDQISRFRNDVYLEGIVTSTETDMLVVDSVGKVTKRAIDAITVDVSDFLTDGADNRVVTATGTDGLLAETYLTFANASNLSRMQFLSNEDTGDKFQITTTTHGATTLTTVDDNATAAHFEIAADGDITLDSAGQIKLEPVAGNNILLDGTIAVDAGVVTGATSITSTAFVGTLSTATQPNIDSIGTDGDTLSILGDNLSIVNTTASKPAVFLTNQADDATSPILTFTNKRVDSSTQAGEDNDYLGKIFFQGYNDQGTPGLHTYAAITSNIHDATSGEESGKLVFSVANHDGGVGSGLVLTGGSENNEIDVTLGLGANSVVTVPGSIAGDVTGDVTGDLSGQAGTVATIAGLAPNTATTQATQGSITSCANLVTVGTIGTGVWQGTAIASDQQKHLMHYQTVGYCQNSGSNYEMTRPMSVNTAPFQHDVSIGADGLTAQTVQVWARAVGHVMPNDCTVKRWRGWTVSPGSTTSYIALFKVTLEDDVDSDPSAVLLTEVSYTPSGNATANSFNTTSASSGGTLEISAGDIIFTAMKGPGNPMYFNATLEVEF